MKHQLIKLIEMNISKEKNSLEKEYLKRKKWVLPVQEIRNRDLYFYNLPIKDYLSTTECHIANLGKLTLFGSYSYLSLHKHPYITKKVEQEVQKYGTGGHGVRTLAGSTELHEELERKIATFKGTEDAITFSSGYICNISTIAALVGRGDTIIADELNHGSIIDGCMLSGAKIKIFRHNDMEHLEALLKEENTGNVLVIADAVFSMDGDIFNLPISSKLCKKYGALLMLDECHSLGTIGKTGKGIEEHFGLPSDVVNVKMGTFSKTIPSQGGYIAGSKRIVDYIRHNARGRLMSGANTPSNIAAAIAALELIEQEPERVKTLHKNVTYARLKLKEANIEIVPSETAIVPIWVGDEWKAFEMTKYCFEQGLYLQAAIYPVVPKGKAILRLSMNTDHTKIQIDRMVEVITAAKKLINQPVGHGVH